jgi:hypothetical protein
MKIEDIVKSRGQNSDSIVLHKEGMFWRAWEESAFLFATHLKDYKPIKKYYKVVDQEVVSLGFPQNSLEEVLALANGKQVVKGEREITISGYTIDNDRFIEWKEKLPLYESPVLKKTGSAITEVKSIVCEKINGFSVVNRSPIECQNFIIELQGELNMA